MYKYTKLKPQEKLAVFCWVLSLFWHFKLLKKFFLFYLKFDFIYDIIFIYKNMEEK